MPRRRHDGGYQHNRLPLQVPSASVNGDENVICRVIEVLQGVISWIKLYYCTVLLLLCESRATIGMNLRSCILLAGAIIAVRRRINGDAKKERS